MERLNLTAYPGARAFVRDGIVHLRDRIAGVPFCDTPEPGKTIGDSSDPQPLADGQTPDEAGLGDAVDRWSWCPQCSSFGHAVGLIQEVPSTPKDEADHG